MDAKLPLKFLQIDSNLNQIRIKQLPLSETIESEMRYIYSINADVIIHRESNRKIQINNEYQQWEKIYEKYLPGYICLKEKAITGDQSENALGILILVRNLYIERIRVEIHDITADPKDESLPVTLPKFAENKIALIFLDDKPVYIAWHAWLARTIDTLWVWKQQMTKIVSIIIKYRETKEPSFINLIDLVSDANLIHPEQVDIWRNTQKTLGFQYSYGTNQDQHISFYGLKHDFVPNKNIRKKKLIGIVASKIENGEVYSIPIDSIDGVLSHRPFKVVYPNIDGVTGQLTPYMISNTEFNDNTWMLIKKGFENVHEMNDEKIKRGENRICGFDHVAFLTEIM